MMETIQPPTDNLYKFIAIGGLAFMFLIMFYLLREQARLREIYIDAQVVLVGGGYRENDGIPIDKELAQAYARRELAHSEMKTLLKLTSGWAGHAMGISFVVEVVGFGLWWCRVQRYDDAILRATAAKSRSENLEANIESVR